MAATQQAAGVERRLFTTDEYDRMAEAGILGEDDRVELIGGEVVRMAAMGARHAGCTTRLTQSLVPRLGRSALVRVQLPVAIPNYDEPEPDVAVVRFREDAYGHAHPTPADVLLLIEVSDSTLEFDRRVKIPLYARAGIPEAWLVELRNEAIERHTEPSPEGYRSVRRFRRGETVTSAALPSLVLAVDEVLGR
jgi:Uma2 family endonuclease